MFWPQTTSLTPDILKGKPVAFDQTQNYTSKDNK